MNRWVGKIAVVTGASTGIGENIAQKLVEEGLQVVGIARRVEMVEMLSKKLSRKSGKLHALKCDVSDETDVKKAFQWIKKNLGPVSILVNNAGIARNNSFIDGDPKVWKQVLDINLFGTAVCTQQAVQQMKEAKIDGHIFNINSIVGHKVVDTGDDTNMYTSSKYGVTAYTEVMRQELRKNELKIKITSISPGLVLTDIFTTGNLTSCSEEVVKKLPHLLPEDVTDGIIYALSTKPHVQVMAFLYNQLNIVEELEENENMESNRVTRKDVRDMQDPLQ